jgi:hypothetical protein
VAIRTATEILKHEDAVKHEAQAIADTGKLNLGTPEGKVPLILAAPDISQNNAVVLKAARAQHLKEHKNNRRIFPGLKQGGLT